VLFLHDLTRADQRDYRTADTAIAALLADKLPPKTPVLDIWNKSDQVLAAEELEGLAISARSGAGLDSLRRRLLEVVGWQPSAEGLFMARERHLRALQQVQAQLERAAGQLGALAPALDLLAEDLRQAQIHLGEITGKFTPDDLLGEIFSKFCIGK
jgi:tRNA modification GTPase